jgi:shikimate dehydrogenase
MADGSTYKLAGVMGWPVRHSRSPLIHNHWIAENGLSGNYVLLPVQPDRIADALRGLSALGFAGCNLTIPHKVSALALVDRVDPLAKRIGAINTIVVESDGSLSGRNTDAFGFIQSLHDVRPEWRADAGPISVLGAGGAARAILAGLVDAGATEIRLVNRSFEKAQELAHTFGTTVQCIPWEDRHDVLADCALLVNTTNLGMQGQPALDLSLEYLPASALVTDIVYTPLETTLLRAAKQRGNVTINGLGMLMNQARLAFEAWFGIRPSISTDLIVKIKASF